MTVERSSVEEANAGVVRAAHSRDRLLLVDRGVESAERGSPEADPRHAQAGLPEPNPLRRIHADQTLPVGKRCAAMLSGSISAL
jgi:hypothetical protein